MVWSKFGYRTAQNHGNKYIKPLNNRMSLYNNYLSCYCDICLRGLVYQN